ncbi:hypothetical protein ACT400_12855 [Acinetobacter baumannii]
MKPEQFIREQGLEGVKDCIEEAEAYGGFYVNAKTLELSKHIPSYDAVSITELIRLVESLDLVKKLGGRSGAIREYFEYVHSGKSELDIRPNELARAIKDHESIYGGGDE